MSNIKLELPIYWTKHFKTQPSKTVLTSLNWYRNAYHYDQNAWKQEMHDVVKTQLDSLNVETIEDCYVLHIDLYYKNPNCDGSNVCPLTEKAVLDALQHYKVVSNDNVRKHVGTTWRVAGQDKNNPRAEVLVTPCPTK